MVTVAYGGIRVADVPWPDLEGKAMRELTLPFFVAAALATAVAAAQTTPTDRNGQSSSSSQPAHRSSRANDTSSHSQQGQQRSKAQNRSAQSATSETRPDATYPHPSGQDSQPDKSSHKTRVATGDSKTGVGTADDRGAKASDQSRPVRKLAERKTYTGSSGSKADPSTVCTTARRTQDGGVDCGMTGNSATEGRVVTKPH